MIFRQTINDYVRRKGNSWFSDALTAPLTRENLKRAGLVGLMAGAAIMPVLNGCAFQAANTNPDADVSGKDRISSVKKTPSLTVDFTPDVKGLCQKYAHIGHVALNSLYTYGNIMSRTQCRNGQPEGTARGWYQNGSEWFNETYFNGKLEGRQEGWYENGQKKYDVSFFNHSSEGKWLEWHINSHPKTERNYTHGQLAGRHCVWTPDGRSIIEELCRANVCKPEPGICIINIFKVK